MHSVNDWVEWNDLTGGTTSGQIVAIEGGHYIIEYGPWLDKMRVSLVDSNKLRPRPKTGSFPA